MGVYSFGLSNIMWLSLCLFDISDLFVIFASSAAINLDSGAIGGLNYLL